MSGSPFLDATSPLPAPPEAQWVWAVVTQSSPLRIKIDGDLVALGITPDDLGGRGTRPVGQRVYCQILNRRLVVVGPSLANTLLPPPSPLSGTLDDVVVPGHYFQSADVNAIPGLGYPIHRAGFLEVFAVSITFCYQRYTAYAGGGSASFVRGKYGGAWDPWKVASDGLTQAQRRGGVAVNTGQVYDTGTVATLSITAAAIPTRVGWILAGHWGYPPSAIAGRVDFVYTNATALTDSFPQDISVPTSGWVGLSEGGSFTVPAGVTGTLLVRGRVSGAYAHWRGHLEWNRSYDG